MNLLLHPILDPLYVKYALVYDDDGCLSISLRDNTGGTTGLCGEVIPEANMGVLKHIEGIGHGHELMILFLLEMYYAKVQIIHLEAVAVETHSGGITQKKLLEFYGKFGFVKNLIAKDPRYPHKVPMVLKNNWKGLLFNVQKYVESQLSSKLK